MEVNKMLNMFLVKGLLSNGKFSKIFFGIAIASVLAGSVISAAVLWNIFNVFIPQHNENQAKIAEVRSLVETKHEAFNSRQAEVEALFAEVDAMSESHANRIAKVKASHAEFRAETEAMKERLFSSEYGEAVSLKE
jgi:hypothetical protein